MKSSKHGNNGPKPDPVEDPQMPEIPVPQVRVMVLGEEMQIPPTWDPETYHPDKRMPWTPEPEPYNPDTYAAWGRKHFGDDWYKLRKTMLEERDIYHDPVYRERQRVLRIMEHKVEGRPFRPEGGTGIGDKGWKRLWTRISKDLGIPSNPASPTPSRDNDDGSTDLSGFNTYDPTPDESREPTPLPADPWERLEYNRRRFNWDEEKYQFEKMFRKEALIDGARTQRENDPGDRELRKKQEAIESFRYVDRTRFSLERRRWQDHLDLPKEGWTHEEIDAMHDSQAAINEWLKENPEPMRSSDYGKAVTPDKRAVEDIWLQKLNAAKIRFYGGLPPQGSGPFGFPETQEERDAMELWQKNTHARVSRQQEREAQRGATGDGLAIEEASKSRVSPRRTKDVLHQIRSGRVTKMARTHLEASLPPDRGRSLSNPNVLENRSDNTRTAPQRRHRQRKTYEKERSSRRLAGQLPEYGILGRGETRPSPRKPSKTYRTSSSGPRSGKRSKNPTEARSVKPQGILKSKQAGTGRPKKLAKGSKG